MSRKIISFDCDGVLNAAPYVPPELRNNKYYAQLKPREDAIPSLHWLSTIFDIYIISTRSHLDSNLGLRAWLHWVLGLELDTIAGVITGPSGGAREGRDGTAEGGAVHMDKAKIIDALECVIHVDDRPDVIRAIPGRGVLFPAEYPESQAAKNVLPTVDGWDGVREFLTTPGMTLYGSEGVSVVSPAEVFIPDPTRGVLVQ